MSDQSDDELAGLRRGLLASTSRVAYFEAAVTTAQERLRRELAKVEKFRELIALCEADEPTTTATQLTLPETVVAPPPPDNMPDGKGGSVPRRISAKTEARPGENKKSRMIREITSLLRLRGAVHRNDLLAHLQAIDLMGHELKPMAHLAAFLSNNRDQFASDGRGNFSLRPITPAHPEPAPPEGQPHNAEGSSTGVAGAP